MAKKNARVVVNAVYFELIQRKADLLDELFFGGDSLTVHESSFKEYDRIDKAWDRADAHSIAGTEEPYVEPKAQKAKK